jgi:hypothetical protein
MEKQVKGSKATHRRSVAGFQKHSDMAELLQKKSCVSSDIYDI